MMNFLVTNILSNSINATFADGKCAVCSLPFETSTPINPVRNQVRGRAFDIFNEISHRNRRWNAG